MIDLMLCSMGNLESAIFSVSNMIEGNNTVALMYKEIPDSIFGFSTDPSGGLVVMEKIIIGFWSRFICFRKISVNQ